MSAHIRLLDEALTRSGASNGPEVRLALSHLSSELKSRAAKSACDETGFFHQAVSVLAKIKGSSSSELLLECLFECGKHFYFAGEHRSMGRAVELLLARAKSADNILYLRKAHSMCGIAHADLGFIADALVHYAETLELAKRSGEPFAVTQTFINVGTAFNYAGMYREAIPCLQRAVTLTTAGSEPAFPYRSMALCNLAQSYMYLGEPERGYAAIQQCLAETGVPRTVDEWFSLAVREWTKVQICIDLGRVDEAQVHAAKCREAANHMSSNRGEMMVVMGDGLCNIWRKDAELGFRQLDRALELSREWPASTMMVLAASVKASEATGDIGRAHRHLKELMTYFRTVREQGISALSALGPTSQFGNAGHPSDSLDRFELQEARLEARVAKLEAESMQFEFFERMAISADLREEQSGGHGIRVGRLSSLLAEGLGLSVGDCRAIEAAARVHDVGKIGIPDRILLNSKVLKDAERHFMNSHVTIGAELLGKSSLPQVRLAEEIARCHHEWWDGTGYPAKKSGLRIPQSSRIVALADVFDALTHGRPYQLAWPIDKALAHIKGLRGAQFDPEMTDIFLALLERLRSEHTDLDEFLGRAARNSPVLRANETIQRMLSREREVERQGVGL